MHTASEQGVLKPAYGRYHPRAFFLPKAHAASLSPQYTAILLTGLMLYLALSPRLICEAAQSQFDSSEFSAEARISVQPLHNILGTVAPVPEQPNGARSRLTLSRHDWGSEDIARFTMPGFLYEAILDLTNLASLSVYEAFFGIPPPLAWVNYRYSSALQWRLDQFMLPSDAASMVAPLSLLMDFSHPSLLPRLFTVAQLHGTLLLPAKDRHALHYAIYTGVLAEDTPDNLLIGAHVSYTMGISEWTIGVDSLYGAHPVGNIFGSPRPARMARLRRDSIRFVGLSLLLEQDKLMVAAQLLHGPAKGEDTSVAVYAKPVFRIDDQWAIFYRFDLVSFGQNLLKFTEHTVGVRFLLVRNIALQAEFLLGHYDNPSIDAQGFRLAGTLRF